jgi:DNA mismatch endonuclease (patch repair protein)
MPDIFTKAKRSEVMSRIRGRGNKDTELALVALFRRHRIRGWRRHTAVFGKPDFVFLECRVTVFVDGCFWHGCPRCYRRPDSNQKYWDKKFRRNRQRDRFVSRELRKRGWRVFRIWAHQLRNDLTVIRRLRRITDDWPIHR